MTRDPHSDDPGDERLIAENLDRLDQDVAPAPNDVSESAMGLGQEFYTQSTVTLSDTKTSSPDRHSPHGGKRMIARALAALSLVACTIAIVVRMQTPASGEKITFGKVLDGAMNAKSLQLSISRKGTKANVVVRMPGHVRWEHSATEYNIARGSQLWRIDERNNSVTSESTPWFNAADKQIDLLAMLGFESKVADRFREMKDSGTVTRQGRKCRVFRMTSSDQLFIEALADFTSGELQSIAAWPIDRREGPPLAELRLLARDVKVDESKFLIAKSLSQDGRIGKVVDLQGVVGLRPLMRKRWTPVARQLLIKPGDWLQTEVRGANASTVALTSQFRVIAGPGSLLELAGPRSVRLHRGEVRIDAPSAAKGVLELVGPRNQRLTIAPGKPAHYRLDRNGKFLAVKTKPIWLTGYEGSSTNESIGSLIANIEGRDVPLSVGFHRVKVEIRDQIARTTIEESFVNRTPATLEGIFHFPLPQDASISGFGMWINGKLVEADVVEKQRAREIYETILREKRDPGLLEWTGGNIFKARVFPIPAHAEKRIRIVYTQVLPLRGNRYRYSYGLRSEMLQKTPLRELSLNVQVHSALPIKTVTCPTHSVRTQLTDHSAQLEFSAQEYTPERDFEIVCEVNASQSDVVMIPHRRGDDGYFLIQLRPPGTEGNWQREILPDGKPLEVLVVCDTSASMDSTKRRQQDRFLASLLASLGPKDRFNLAVCDVDCRWLHKESIAADAKTRAAAREWLATRTSLGWTNLDRMTQSVLQRSHPGAHVIYVGDGIVTAGDADAQTFVSRLRTMTDEKKSGTFHAISVGNSFESTVLKGLARVGGGLLRQISGEQTPQKVALELLNEIAQPGLRDLKIEFRGLQVAAVYPEKLPNLSAGTQQIIIGRYLPQGKDQKGEIIISGNQAGRTVRFASRVSLTDAEAGNSFIPRLWARGHLDHLMQQGKSPTIRDDIIGLSEEFHIITPYTSMLVLESDADRERFGVKRRFQMRDGERFFTQGRNNATYELLQQQMKRAGDWRLGLRRRILSDLLGLGRNSQLLQRYGRGLSQGWYGGGPFGETVTASAGFPTSGGRLGGFGGGGGGGGGGGEFLGGFSSAIDLGRLSADDMTVVGGMNDFDKQPNGPSIDSRLSDFGGLELEQDANIRSLQQSREQLAVFGGESNRRLEGNLSRSSRSLFDVSSRLSSGGLLNQRFILPGHHEDNRYIQWIDTLFPSMPGLPVNPPTKTTWTGEALKISRSLIQKPGLKAGGIEIVQRSTYRDARWNRITAIHDRIDLAAAKRWLTTTRSAGTTTQVAWTAAGRRGVFSRAFQLGRIRASHSLDLKHFAPGQRAYAVRPIHVAFDNYTAAVQREGERVTLTLTEKVRKETQVILEIDTKRNVVLKVVNRHKNKVTSSSTYSDYKQVGGAWWPGTIESFDSKERRTSIVAQKVRQLSVADFASRFQAELPDQKKAILLRVPLPTTRQASIAASNGSATIEHRLVLLRRAARIQKWKEVLKQLAAIEELHSGRPGLAWIRAEVLISARKNDQAREILERQAQSLAGGKVKEEYRLASFVLDRLRQIADQNETLRLIDKLQVVFDRQPQHAFAKRALTSRRIYQLRGLGRTDEFLKLQRDLAETGPWDLSAQTAYANYLAAAGDHPAAYAWLRQEIDRKVERTPQERSQFRRTYAQLLRRQGRADEYAALLKEWSAEAPDAAVYLEYLSALQLASRGKEADAMALKWIREIRSEKKLEPRQLAKVNSAISYALGQRYQQYTNRMDEKWYKPLAETARFWLSHKHHYPLARRIVGFYKFTSSDESDRLRREIAAKLKADAKTLRPQQVADYVNWTIGRDALKKADWIPLAKLFRARWKSEKKRTPRSQLAGALHRIYRRFQTDELLPFLRQEIVTAAKTEKDAARLALFSELLSRDWRDQHESEALELISSLASQQEDTARLLRQIGQLHRFVDRMLKARYSADAKKLQDSGHTEKLTRQELAARRKEFLAAAQRGLVSRLDAFIQKQAQQGKPDSEWLAWVRLERVYLQVKLADNLDQVAVECWKMIGESPWLVDANSDPYVDQATRSKRAREALVRLRLERAFATLNYLAVRRSAAKALAEHLVRYVAEGTRLKGEAASPWKARMFRLRVALDQPDPLISEVRSWIRSDPFPAPWQLTLGRLLAERGRIDEAIQIFENVERTDQLAPADFATLSDWYLVRDRRALHERTKIAVYKAMPEYRIRNWLRGRRRRWTRIDVPLPTELDRNVLFALKALFEKSNQPQTYVRELKDLYTASRDYRLLQMIPDALIGRTAQQIYPFLRSLDSNLMSEIRDEATADAILERIARLRKKDLSAIDLRACDLLEVMVERRSSEVLNQPGPHIAAAVSALQRAFERQWASGEVRQMSAFLDRLGVIRQAKLSDERLRQLRAFHPMTTAGTIDRLYVTWHLSHSLFYSHERRREGIAMMQNGVKEFSRTQPAGWPSHANGLLGNYLGLLEAARQFAVAEKVLTANIDKPVSPSQKRWFIRRRYTTYTEALRHGGRVSLGEGQTLYEKLHADIIAQLQQAKDDEHRSVTLGLLLQVYDVAKLRDIRKYRQDMRRFGFQQCPAILKKQTNNYQGLVSQILNRIKTHLGMRAALKFAIERFEAYPQRFEYTYQNAWQQLSSQMASWHHALKRDIGALEPRLLSIVLRRLRHDLQTRHRRSRYFYDKQYYNRYFWTAKAADFARVAEEVLKSNPSGRSVSYIAAYMHGGLDLPDRAIEVMMIANSQGRLDYRQQIQLCDYLHGGGRHGESISILEPIVKAHPDIMSYRTRLLTAYHQAKRPQQLQKLLAETDAHFRQAGRWSSSNIAMLANNCRENRLFQKSVGYYGELIPIYQRTSPNRGVGTYQLANYYIGQARAYAGLGQTKKAVTAASAAVVAWGSKRNRQSGALSWLYNILAGAKDLDAFVKEWDADVEKDHRDSPIIRKRIGMVYASRKQHQKAVVQFRAAIALQRTDVETHQKLILSLDALQDHEGAIRQTLALLDFHRHDLNLYQDLARRLAKNEAEAERAATTLVEAAPSEAEHHGALATMRQKQDRWPEAIDHWKQVARLRALEPDGLLKLAGAQIHERRFVAAQATLNQLNRTVWPERFGDLRPRIRDLEKKIPSTQ